MNNNETLAIIRQAVNLSSQIARRLQETSIADYERIVGHQAIKPEAHTVTMANALCLTAACELLSDVRTKVAGWPDSGKFILIPNPAKQPLETYIALMKPGEFEYTWFNRGAFKPGFPDSRGVGIPYQGTGNLIAREDGALAEIWEPV